MSAIKAASYSTALAQLLIGYVQYQSQALVSRPYDRPFPTACPDGQVKGSKRTDETAPSCLILEQWLVAKWLEGLVFPLTASSATPPLALKCLHRPLYGQCIAILAVRMSPQLNHAVVSGGRL